LDREPEDGAAKRLASEGIELFRTGTSRILGVALIFVSAVLFGVAFVSGFLPFEIASLISFILGVALLAAELEPRARLSISAAGMLGYLRTLDGAMKLMNITGKATYVPYGNQVRMVMTQGGANSQVELPPVGSGLNDEITAQLGDVSEKGLEFFTLWIPRTLVDNLSVSDNVKVSRDGAKIAVAMSKPFVRRLCVDPFVNANVCCRMGCPLAGSVAQALAVTTGQEVHFENCAYDPKKQRAETTMILGKSG
jgi:hypothetical protein